MSIWFTEELHPYYRKGVRIKRILADEQTQYQHLQFVETEFFGNAMILDGIIQMTERDNMGYHEMIVHVPMLVVGRPKRVLIVGGGDGGALQQVLRYPSLEEVIICELDRRVVDLLVGMPERNRFVRGIRSWVGLDQIGLAYERHARHAGKPKFTFTRLVYLALDGLVSFSYIPLRVITVLGFVVSFISIVLAIFYVIQRLTIGLYPPGFATLTVAIFFLAGIQLITIGVIGEYVGRIFEEVKRRPLYVVRQLSGGQR